MIDSNQLVPVNESPLGVFDNSAYNLIQMAIDDPVGVAMEVAEVLPTVVAAAVVAELGSPVLDFFDW